MGTSDELVKQLRDALARQNDAKLALLKHERQKAADRVEKLEGDIVRFESDREDEQRLIANFKLLTRAAEEGRPAKLNGKNAVNSARKARSLQKPTRSNQTTP